MHKSNVNVTHIYFTHLIRRKHVRDFSYFGINILDIFNVLEFVFKIKVCGENILLFKVLYNYSPFKYSLGTFYGPLIHHVPCPVPVYLLLTM
jgi:hypothetical protein